MFRSDFSRVKLCDFGESKKVSTMVQRRNEWLPYTAPEIISTETDETYKWETAANHRKTFNDSYLFRTDFTHDIWQYGIVIFICLTGKGAENKLRLREKVFRWSLRVVNWITLNLITRKLWNFYVWRREREVQWLRVTVRRF